MHHSDSTLKGTKSLRSEKNVSLRNLNTFGFDVIARFFVRIEKEEYLVKIFHDPYFINIEHKLVLGEGSNTLFVDKFFNGLIIHMCIKGFTIVTNDDDNSKIILKVGAGEKWTDLINYTVQHGYKGLEYLAGIPGTVGAAPIQNISAYGAELSEIFLECQAFDTQNKCFVIFDKDACQFAYRKSRFKQDKDNLGHMRYIITHVTVELLRSSPESVELQSKNIINRILKRRSIKLPDPWLDFGNAGSFFLNPIITNDQYKKIMQQEQTEITHYRMSDNQIKIPAGWLIEKCDRKGYYLRTAGTWHSHANVLINNGSNNGYDLWTLAKDIRTVVEKRFHIRLEAEVNIIRMFKPIKTMTPSKLIIRQNHSWKNENVLKTIHIPSDKNACVHLLFAAIGLRQVVCFKDGFYENISYDVARILQWIDENNVADLYFHNYQSLTIIPNGYKLTDLTSASFSRASIDLAGNTLLTYGSVRCVELGGCQFTQRPIDLHLNLLVTLGGHSDDGEKFYLKKNWNDCNDDFEFDCRTKNNISSVGLTIHAILSCCALPNHIQCKLTYVALEVSVQAIIQLVSKYRSLIVNEFERTVIFEKTNSCSNHNLVLEHVPIDQNYLFTMCSFAAALKFKLVIKNFEYDRCITKYLKSIMPLDIDDTNSTVLIDGTTSFIHNQNVNHKLICDIYPDGLPTDISPILTALFTARNIAFELVDRIYDTRSTQCKEFTKLGYDINTNGNTIIYNKIKHGRSSCKDLFAHDIRSGVAVLLLALYHVNTNEWKSNDEIILHQYEQIQRGYGDLLYQKLCEFGFDVRFIS